jgi:hypothetical protein
MTVTVNTRLFLEMQAYRGGFYPRPTAIASGRGFLQDSLILNCQGRWKSATALIHEIGGAASQKVILGQSRLGTEAAGDMDRQLRFEGQYVGE